MHHPYEAALTEALINLRTAQQLLLDEISSYPTPISGCDAQFNQLLSDRTRISNSLHMLDAIPFVPTPRVLERGAESESR